VTEQEVEQLRQDVERCQGEAESKMREAERLEQEKKQLISQLVEATKDAHKYLEDKRSSADRLQSLSQNLE